MEERLSAARASLGGSSGEDSRYMERNNALPTRSWFLVPTHVSYAVEFLPRVAEF